MGGEVGSVSGESRGEGGEGPADEVKHDVQTTAGTSHLEKVKAVGWAQMSISGPRSPRNILAEFYFLKCTPHT